MLPVMEHLGEVLKRRRGILGLSQAELAEGAGVHLRQIRRYESGEQQPVLAIAARLAGTLGVSVDELAGVAGEQVVLEGTWWAAWQLFVEGNEGVATLPVGLTQHGSVIEIEALETERRGAPWRGELRLWKGPALTGWYADAGGDVRSRGTMLFLLRDGGAWAEGRWVGLAADGSLVSGHAALARTRDDAQAVIARLTA
jgi:transcriptional regulator with XRE-family HTH domain